MSSDPSPGPAERNEGVSPRGDDWGQEAVLDELLAAFDSELRQTATADRSDQVPECMGAGFLPRGRASGPAITNLARGGRRTGFAPGAELDTALPGPAERVQLRYNYRLYPALKAAGMAGTMNQLRVRAYLDVLLGQDSSPVLAGQDSSARQSTEGADPAETDTLLPGASLSHGAGDSLSALYVSAMGIGG